MYFFKPSYKQALSGACLLIAVILPAHTSSAYWIQSQSVDLTLDLTYFKATSDSTILTNSNTTSISADYANDIFVGFGLKNVLEYVPDIYFRYFKYDSHKHSDTGTSKIEHLQQDLILYYNYNLPLFRLTNQNDIGLSLKKISHDSVLGNNANKVFSDSFKQTVYNLYIKSSLEMPVDGLSIGALFSHSISSTDVIDKTHEFTIFINYLFDYELELQFGLLSSAIEVTDTNVYPSYNQNTEHSGIYLKALWHIVDGSTIINDDYMEAEPDDLY